MSDEIKKWHAPCGIYCKLCPGLKIYKCGGCREAKGQILKFPVCKTYECVTNKGYEFCFECAEFPCEMLQPIVNFEIFLPHNSKVYSLLMIQKHGLKKWNELCEEKLKLYYEGRKIKYGGDFLTLEKKDKNMYKKKDKHS
ncbi:MAG: DUF3795 domain-containing protein [Candidatus Helarchaeota archaeon]